MDNDLQIFKILYQQVEKVAEFYGVDRVDVVNIPVNEKTKKAIQIKFPPHFSLYLFPVSSFPIFPPVAVMDWYEDERRTFLPLHWELGNNMDAKGLLLSALKKHIFGAPPFKIMYGPHIKKPITDNYELGKKNNWQRMLIGDNIIIQTTIASAKSRLENEMVDALVKTNILFVGAGSVGSYMAEQLVRSGLSTMTVIDPDIVEHANLSRTIYDCGDIGKNKVESLSNKMLLINPAIKIEQYPYAFENIDSTLLYNLFSKADVIIATTDEPRIQSLINSCSFHTKKPALYIALYKGAKGGEVALTVPSVTPCFRCMVGLRRVAEASSERVESNLNYGTGRLQGEIALNCDIQHVASAALKICYSVVASLKKAKTISISNFTPKAIAEERHLLTMGMEPNYWFYDQIFNNTSGQYSFQSVWLTATSSPDCPVCGDLCERSNNPFDSIQKSPDPQKIREKFNYFT